MVDSPAPARRAVEAVWRIESSRLIASLARATGDVGAAGQLAQDAFVAALQQWPAEGVPENPGPWLLATARRRFIDRARRDRKLREIHEELGERERRRKRGDLLLRLGRRVEARAEFERAAELTRNERERELLRERAGACGTAIPRGEISEPVKKPEAEALR